MNYIIKMRGVPQRSDDIHSGTASAISTNPLRDTSPYSKSP